VAPAAKATVRFVEQEGVHLSRFLVQSAEAASDEEAQATARLLAVGAAGQQMGGSESEKRAIDHLLFTMPEDALEFAGVKRVTKRKWGAVGPRIDAMVDVDVTALRTFLTTRGAMQSDVGVASGVGNPTLMVLPSSVVDRESSHRESEIGEIGVDVISSFFTSRRWDLVDRKAIRAAQERLDAMGAIAGLPADPTAQVAAMAGADIYVTFSVQGRSNRSATVSVRAYDSVSGTVQAASVESSREYTRGADRAAMVREALANAMPAIFENLRGYWQQATQDGLGTHVVIRGDFSERSHYKAVRVVLKELGTWKKKAVTKESVTGVLRSTEDPDDLLDELIDVLKEEGFNRVDVIVEQRSMLLLEVGR
jgi:hypothetical protein